jgi:hypothetical protein
MMPLLFTRVSIFDLLQLQQDSLKAEIKNLDGRVIEEHSEQELVQMLAAKYKLEVPVLEEEKASMSHREVEVDVSQDPMRFITDRGRPFYIKGTEITISVPFKGDPQMFQVKPSTFTLNPPRGEVRGHEISLKYIRSDNNAMAVKSEYQRAVQDVKQHLTWMEHSVGDFNSKVGQEVQSQLFQRKQVLTSAAEMVSAIGIPIKHSAPKPVSQPRAPEEAIRRSITSPKKWDVFISHASEDKELVRPLAQALRDKGIAVWYDEFSLKLGDSLRSSIDYGLANSRYGVVVLSKSFFAKHWPVQELNGLSSKEAKGTKVILPVWHKLSADDVREFSPMLADKFASTSEQGIDQLVEDIVNALRQA